MEVISYSASTVTTHYLMIRTLVLTSRFKVSNLLTHTLASELCSNLEALEKFSHKIPPDLPPPSVFCADNTVPSFAALMRGFYKGAQRVNLREPLGTMF